MSEKLKAWMAENGLGNSQLAERVGVTRELVWLFASGKREITGTFKWKFGEVFGFDAAQAVFSDMPDCEPEQVQA